MSKWISVKGYKEVPIGNWLVKADCKSHGCNMSVIKRKENVTMIGDHFAFDHAPIIAYHPLPEE
jgi:hypothetical protein